MTSSTQDQTMIDANAVEGEALSSKFSQELLKSIYVRCSDNYDEARFGRRSRKEAIRDRIALFLQPFSLFVRQRSFDRDSEVAAQLDQHWAGLEFLYRKLGDNWSRELLPKLLAFRVLGAERVKLPQNTREYWHKRKQIPQMKVGTESIPLSFLNWKLEKYNLTNLGFPIELFYNVLGISCTFLLQQYRYARGSVSCAVEPGDFVIDAGGCWGDTALYFANLVGDSGRVFSFEFIASNLEILRRNLSLNQGLAPRVNVVENPIWSHSREKIFYWDNGAGSTVSSVRTAQCTAEVETISIDDFVQKNQLPKLDFIKMDIEGAELDSLIGAQNSLRKFRPKLAISVYHKLSHFYEIAQYLDSLELGYDFFLDHFTIYGEETILFAIPSLDERCQ